MRASIGDELVVHARHVGEHGRTGVIVEVHGAAGAPPYLVRWDSGVEAVFFPSADCTVKHAAGSDGPAKPAR